MHIADLGDATEVQCLSKTKSDHILTALGATALSSSSDQLRQFLADETEKWATVIRAAGIKPE